MSWKLTVTAPRPVIEAALARHDEGYGGDDLIIAGYELAADQPEIWQLDAYFDAKPTPDQRSSVRALFAGPSPSMVAEKLPDADWLTVSQQAVAPIRAGRFFVHTPDHQPMAQAGVTNFCIPAAQAFGTGHHQTTSGCLEMLDTMQRVGLAPRHVADIGTGTGLLAFAARALWPNARFTASDIDPLCDAAVIENAQRNAVPLGTGPGALVMRVADGMDDRVLAARAPYDLLIANILAGPLVDLAPFFALATAPRASLLLSGLLVTQEPAVRAAYARAGFRLHKRLHRGDWSILWLRHRFPG